MKSLDVTRKELDVIDSQIKQLFADRLELTKDVIAYKMEVGKPIIDLAREKEKLDAVSAGIEDEFKAQAVRELFTQIMSIGKKLQYKILCEDQGEMEIPFTPIEKLHIPAEAKIAYQGVEGAYGNAAALQFFGEDADIHSVPTFEAAMKEVADGEADFAVLPIENSRAGGIGDVCDLLMKYDNIIVAETYLKVEHCLLALPGTKMEDIRTIYSHPQGLMQCAGFLDQYPDIQRVSKSNTAVSAKKVVEEANPAKAAIASELAGKLYGLEVLQRGISDDKNNTTRFVIVQKRKEYVQDAKKVSICVETEHVSGALYSQLSHFIFNSVNMTKIESRPVPDRAWEYRFYIDLEGNLSESKVISALQGIEAESRRLKILGNY